MECHGNLNCVLRFVLHSIYFPFLFRRVLTSLLKRYSVVVKKLKSFEENVNEETDCVNEEVVEFSVFFFKFYYHLYN